MVIFVTIVHVLMCLFLIAVVLLQTGKGADMGAAFGGAGQTLFGGAGPANFLNKMTAVVAVVFMLTSFALTVLSSRAGSSGSKVLDATPVQTQPASQVTPAAEQAQPQATTAAPATTQEPAAAPQPETTTPAATETQETAPAATTSPQAAEEAPVSETAQPNSGE